MLKKNIQILIEVENLRSYILCFNNLKKKVIKDYEMYKTNNWEKKFDQILTEIFFMKFTCLFYIDISLFSKNM